MPRQKRTVLVESSIVAWFIRWTVSPLFSIRINDPRAVVGIDDARTWIFVHKVRALLPDPRALFIH